MHGDLLAIHNTLAEYCLAADEHRFEDWARCFTEDGEMHAFRRVWKGFDELVSHIRAAPEGLHVCGLPHVTLKGDLYCALMPTAMIQALGGPAASVVTHILEAEALFSAN